MKKIVYIFAAVAALILTASCQKEAGRLMDDIVGDWHYSVEESGVKEDIWISFAADGTFGMYQKIGEGPYWFSEGEYSLDAETKVLSGVYSDRYPWKYSYKVSISDRTLVMTAVELETYVVTYEKAEIPVEVRQKSLPLTKSESVERYL